MKIALIILALVIGLIAFVVVIGYLLPVKHVANRSIKLNMNPEKVWAMISDFKSQVNWRKELQSVEQVELSTGVFAWKETDKSGDSLTYLTLQAEPEKKLVRKIADVGIPFGGTWTYELFGDGAGTRLTITEDGEVYNPVFRFMSRFVFGHYASLDRYLGQLPK
jgi:hypothetical protein